MLSSHSENKYVALKSVFYPSQHVGILENGELKPPSETTAQDRSSLFIPYPQPMATVSVLIVQGNFMAKYHTGEVTLPLHTQPTKECPPDTHAPSTTAENPGLTPPYTGPPQEQTQGQYLSEE